MTQPQRAITVAILAMGGEGGGVLADWIIDMAEHAGYLAQTTSVPGVAQRTGATIYYLELFPAAVAAGRQPVLALMPTPGEVDVVLASELMEAGRAIQRGLVTPDKTTLIASSHRVYSMTEKSAMGDGRVDAQQLVAGGEAAAKRFIARDFAGLAAAAGSVISASLFGALAATGALPFARQDFEAAIRRGGVGIDASLAAFTAGHAAVAQPASPALPAVASLPPLTALGPRLAAQAQRIVASFPAAAAAILGAGVRRLADYQDLAYADEYLTRLEAIRELDRQHGDGSWRLLCETARYLALWMSYEDTVRVADLKTRRARFARVHEEVGTGAGEILQINEFLHPRLEEIADSLPAALGEWLLASGWPRRLVERYTARGRVVQTSSLGGFLLLYGLARLAFLRRGSLRFRQEQAAIAEWIQRIGASAASDYGLALEIAECQRLVKGYGGTRARGAQNFTTLMDLLPALGRTPDAAARLRRLREAALADEAGEKLAAMLGSILQAP